MLNIRLLLGVCCARTSFGCKRQVADGRNTGRPFAKIVVNAGK
jgi:hypothetical protein